MKIRESEAIPAFCIQVMSVVPCSLQLFCYSINSVAKSLRFTLQNLSKEKRCYLLAAHR